MEEKNYNKLDWLFSIDLVQSIFIDKTRNIDSELIERNYAVSKGAMFNNIY